MLAIIAGSVRRPIRVLRRISRYWRLFGPRGALVYFRELCGDKRTIRIHCRGWSIPIALRLNSTDIPTALKVLGAREYEIELAREPRVIIDAGANIGLASIYYSTRFPGAKIYAIEPEAKNLALLQENVAAYPNVICVAAALWCRNERVPLFDRNTGPWGFAVIETNTKRFEVVAEIEGRTLDGLMRQFAIDWIDILKVDIEGAEREVFGACDAWIGQVGVIAIELHEWMKAGCSQAFYDAVADFPKRARNGENVFVMRDDYWKARNSGREARVGAS